jgi:hypothetical protein
MDPKKGPIKISQQEAARKMRAAQALKVPPRSQSPIGGSSDDDDPSSSEWIWSQTKGCARRNKHFRAPAATVDTKAVDTMGVTKVQPTVEPTKVASSPIESILFTWLASPRFFVKLIDSSKSAPLGSSNLRVPFPHP